MEKIRKIKAKCPCCGTVSEIEKLDGLYRNGPMNLDLYPGTKEVFRRVNECPSCGYAGFDFGDTLADAVKEYVAAGKHLEGAPADETERKLIAAARIQEAGKALKSAAYLYLMLSWYLRETGKDIRSALESAARLYAEYLKDNRDEDPAITYIDIARMLGEFDEAEESVESLLDALSDDPYRKGLVEQELELIRAKDTGRHSVKGAKR